MRSDELASQAQIERFKTQGANLTQGIKTAAGIATAGFGAGLSSRILPLLNDFVPIDLAIKGINKISPKLGGMLQKGMEEGLDVKDGLNFLKDHVGKSQKPSQEQFGAAIRKYSPELMDFLEEAISKGEDPLRAGMVAQYHPKFQKAISQMEKDYKSNFTQILGSIFGSRKVQKGSEAPMESQQMDMFANQQQQQGGQGQQALMAILQKINQTRGGA